MNAHARGNTKGAQSVRELPVDHIVMEGFFPVPLSDDLEKVLAAYEKAVQNPKGFANAKDITKLKGTANSRRTTKKLWELVRCGRVVAYHSTAGKWFYCTPKVAEKMLKYEPQLLTAYADLTKNDDGIPL